MIRNEVLRDADSLSLPVPAGTRSGDPVRVGGLIGVALTDRAQSVENPSASDHNRGGGNAEGYATVRRCGMFRLPVVGAVTTVGTPVYLLANGTLSVTAASGAIRFGYVVTTKTAAAAPADVILSERPEVVP